MTVPADVVAAYGWQSADIAPLPGGLINATYAVRVAGEPVAVVQRLHPVFGAEVNFDIDAVTMHLAARGLATPRLVHTTTEDAWVTHGDRVWRALTWVDGLTVHKVPDPSWAEAAGELVGRFHVAVSDFAHDYRFVRAGVHDTAAHLDRLRACVDAQARGDRSRREAGAGEGQAPIARAPNSGGDEEAIALGNEVLAAANALPQMPVLPRRHCHGDLKISNVLFAAPAQARALVDLDTVGLQTIAFEFGDAMRSWCNPHAEDAGTVGFDLAIFEAAVRGFLRTAASVVTPDERVSIVTGLETVCIELAARFAVDVFRDEYFGWDPQRFPTRRAHNLVRARGQLGLGFAVRAAREDALVIVRR